MKAELIIFDFDGTLADSAKGIIFSFQHTLEKFGIKNISDEKIRMLIGLPLEEMFERIVPEEKKKDVAALAAAYRENHAEHAVGKTKLFPHVKETLTEMKKRGKKLAVATTKRGQFIFTLSESLGILRLFDTVLCAENVENQKPAPDIILLALKRTGTKNTKAIVVGDTTMDILAAKAAQVKSIGVSFGIGSANELKKAGATKIISDFRELLEIIG